MRPSARALDRYVRDCAARMRLGWRVTVSAEPADPGHVAEILYCEDMLAVGEVEMRFAPDFWSLSPTEQRAKVAHELCHLPLLPLWDHVGPVLAASLPAATFATESVAYERHEERAVEALAQAVALGLPLPPWAAQEDDG